MLSPEDSSSFDFRASDELSARYRYTTRLSGLSRNPSGPLLWGHNRGPQDRVPSAICSEPPPQGPAHRSGSWPAPIQKSGDGSRGAPGSWQPASGTGRRVRSLRPVGARAGAPGRVHAPLSRSPRP
jgi:hypothetical protein